jgi:hypothetical protein
MMVGGLGFAVLPDVSGVVELRGLGGEAIGDELLPFGGRLVRRHVERERIAQIFDVFRALQFRNAGRQHHRKQRDEQRRVPAHDVVRLLAKRHKLFEIIAILSSQHLCV